MPATATKTSEYIMNKGEGHDKSKDGDASGMKKPQPLERWLDFISIIMVSFLLEARTKRDSHHVSETS